MATNDQMRAMAAGQEGVRDMERLAAERSRSAALTKALAVLVTDPAIRAAIDPKAFAQAKAALELAKVHVPDQTAAEVATFSHASHQAPPHERPTYEAKIRGLASLIRVLAAEHVSFESRPIGRVLTDVTRHLRRHELASQWSDLFGSGR